MHSGSRVVAAIGALIVVAGATVAVVASSAPSAAANAPSLPAPRGFALVTVHGAKWCGPCHELQDGLRAKNIPFVFVDIDENPGAWAMASKAAGTSSIPLTSVTRGPFVKWVVGSDVKSIESAYGE